LVAVKDRFSLSSAVAWSGEHGTGGMVAVCWLPV
jgi:hypothetical protein